MKNNLFKKMLIVAIMLTGSVIFAQTVSGTVSDETGPLPGASVVVKGAMNGTNTDFDGNFTLDNVPSDAILIVSFIGFDSQEISITGQSVINITLTAGAESLDEVIITSLGLSRDKKSIGYSATQIDGAEISLVKEANVASGLVGKVAGVVVTKSTSGPGGGTRIVIRGNNSINGNNQPLYVVDGIPIDNSGISSNGVGQQSISDFGTGISDINPDDIESMTILKGPNAAALYGSRASNGVIIITTKKGVLSKGLGVSFNSSVTFDNPLVIPEYQNQYGRGQDGKFSDISTDDDLSVQVNTVTGNSSWGPKFDGSSQLEFNGKQRAYSAQPDNVEDFFETGVTVVNTLSINGSGEKSSVYFSYTNSDITSILPNSSLKRNNFNLRGFSKLSDKLTFDSKITYFLQDAKNRPTQGTEGLAAYLWTLPRNVSISDMKNYQDIDNPIDPDNPYAVISPSGTGNPYWMLYEDSNEDKRRRVTGFAKLDYQITDYLSVFARVGTDVVNHNTESVAATGHHFYPEGWIRFEKNEITETNYDFLFQYNKDINKKFNLSANFGGNARISSRINSTVRGLDFQIPGKWFLSNTDGTQISATQTDLVKKKVNSLYGQASLAYSNMVYLDLTARNDWSSALAADNRSYFYSSASLSVLLNKIFQWEDTKIDMLKFRASGANVGNDTGAQQIDNMFNIASTGYLGNTVVSRSTVKYSDDIKPEDITSAEVGFELKMFRNRLFADFSYYTITSKDLIFDVPVDAATGYSHFRENVGEISNKGFELLIGGVPVQNDNFYWETSFNIAHNKNELVSLIDGQDNFTFSTSNSGVVDVRAEVDGGYGDIYTKTWMKNDVGQLILTAEGRPQATAERVKSGNYQPDFTGGFSNTFSYKNFSLRALIDFRIGGEIYSGTDSGLDASGVSERSLLHREGGITVDGVIDDGNGGYTQNTINISGQEYWQSVSGIGSEYVYDQTNVRLREVSLTYRFPSKHLENTFVQSASLSAVGRNLFFIYKEVDNFDPESSYSTNNFSQGVLYYALPTTTSVGLSLNVKF
ncbi:SusC/RagA family TonB-linked outer membrane protein [Flavicella sp.]|uniref:SusC/RagA family TonB-linked outer membrane protein n=1 Tax=Flavicella sp. TaxID=2957742 RepID=UPI003017F580